MGLDYHTNEGTQEQPTHKPAHFKLTQHAYTIADSFRAYMSQFGPVENAFIVVDRVTRRSRGFGFVVYSSKATADHVLSIPDGQLTLDGRRVKHTLNMHNHNTHSPPLLVCGAPVGPKAGSR